MNKLQEQILYSNGKESKEETRLAKNRLRKDLMNGMCYWAENSDRLKEGIVVKVVGSLPKPFHPGIFEKREFREIIGFNLDMIYEENRLLCINSKMIALNLLSKFYWR